MSQIKTGSKQLEKIKGGVWELMKKNRRTTDGLQYTVPSSIDYPYQWLWDSCFNAVILSHFNPDDAKKELLTLVSRQLPNGLIPHMIYWQKGELHNIPWGMDGTSSVTQPPMVAYAALRIYQKDGDKEFLRSIYPNLYHFYNYLLSERDPRHNNLAGIIHPDESGEDNSPRFDSLLGLPPNHTLQENFKKRLELVDKNRSCNFDAPFCMKNFFWVKDVPFNVILVENLRSLAVLAEALENKEDALHYKEQSLKITLAMRDRMFEDGVFWSTYGIDYKKLKVKTWAIFAPLFAQILSPEEAKKLVADYMFNPSEFETPFMVPTVARSEPSYDPSGFWRGPVWMATNWFIYQGLKNYGMTSEAERIAEGGLALVEKSGFRERFNPETGDGLGASDFTWGGLVLDMLE